VVVSKLEGELDLWLGVAFGILAGLITECGERREEEAFLL